MKKIYNYILFIIISLFLSSCNLIGIKASNFLDKLEVPKEVYGSFHLEDEVEIGNEVANIVWTSNNEVIEIDRDYAIVKKSDLDVDVTLTAVALFKNESATKNFNVKVISKKNASVINFWMPFGSTISPLFEEKIKQFEIDHPDWKINMKNKGDYSALAQNVIDAIKNDESPDIVISSDFLAKVTDHIVDLNKYINDSKIGFSATKKADFMKVYFERGVSELNGAMYSLPFIVSSDVLYYNKSALDELNLTRYITDDDGATWEDITLISRKLKEVYPESIPIGLDSADNLFINTALQKNSPYTQVEKPHYVFDNEVNRNFVKEFKKYYDEGLLTTKNILGEYTSGPFTQDIAKKIFMSIGSNVEAVYYNSDGKFEVGIANVPYFKNDYRRTIYADKSIFMLKQENEEKMRMSWEFINNYLLDTDFQVSLSLTSGYIPVLNSAIKDKRYTDYLNEADGYNNLLSLASKTFLKEKKYFVNTPIFDGAIRCSQMVGILVNSAISSSESIENAFQEALEECKNYIENYSL